MQQSDETEKRYFHNGKVDDELDAGLMAIPSPPPLSRREADAGVGQWMHGGVNTRNLEGRHDSIFFRPEHWASRPPVIFSDASRPLD